MNLFIYYPKCSTCKKVKEQLDNKNISYKERNIKEENPTKEEIKSWALKYQIPIRKFFNTSGLLYRELSLKDKLDSMSEEDQLNLLGKNGMLVKRPIFITEEKLIIGNSKKDYEDYL